MGDRQFEPTPERLRKARKEGKSPRSPLFTGSVLFLSVVLGLFHFPGNNWVRIKLLVECLWSQEFTNAGECGRVAVVDSIQILIIFLLGILVLSVSITALQVGKVWVPAVLIPDLKRISPASGFERFLGSFKGAGASLCLLLSASMAGAGLTAVVVMGLARYHELFLFQQVSAAGEDLRWLLNTVAIIALAGGCVELLRKRYQYRQQVFMDYQEMRREQREQDGDPHLKAHRRSLHQALAREEMIRQIKKSRVILVECAKPGGGR